MDTKVLGRKLYNGQEVKVSLLSVYIFKNRTKLGDDESQNSESGSLSPETRGASIVPQTKSVFFLFFRLLLLNTQ